MSPSERNSSREGQVLEQFARVRRAVQHDGPRRAARRTDAAAHAARRVYAGGPGGEGGGLERAGGRAGPAPGTALRVDPGQVARGRQHGDSVAPGLHGPAAARAAVADRVKPPQHGFLEESVVNIAALARGLQHVERLVPGDPAAFRGVVFGDKPRERLADDQADVERQAGVRPRASAGAVQQDDVIRVFQDHVPGELVGHHGLEPGEADIAAHGDEPARCIGQQHLAVVGVGEPELGPGGAGGRGRSPRVREGPARAAGGAPGPPAQRDLRQ